MRLLAFFVGLFLTRLDAHLYYGAVCWQSFAIGVPGVILILWGGRSVIAWRQ